MNNQQSGQDRCSINIHGHSSSIRQNQKRFSHWRDVGQYLNAKITIDKIWMSKVSGRRFTRQEQPWTKKQINQKKMRHATPLILYVLIIIMMVQVVPSNQQLSVDCLAGTVLSLLSVILTTEYSGTCYIDGVLSLASGVNMILAPNAKIVLRGSGDIVSAVGGVVLLQQKTAGQLWEGVEIQTKSVTSYTLNKVRITGAKVGVSVTGSTNVVISNSIISGSSVALQVTGSGGINVQASTFTNNAKIIDWILTDSLPSSITFSGNTLTGGGKLSIKNYSGPVQLVNNVVSGVFSAVVKTTGSSVTTIQGNTFNGAYTSGEAFIDLKQSLCTSGAQLIVSSNTFSKTSSTSAIKLSTGAGCGSLLQNNKFLNTTVDSILDINQLDGTTKVSQCIIDGGIISSSQIISVQSTLSGAVEFIGNTIANVTGAASFAISTNGSAAVTLQANTIESMSVGILSGVSNSIIDNTFRKLDSITPLLSIQSANSSFSISGNLFDTIDAVSGGSITGTDYIGFNNNILKNSNLNNGFTFTAPQVVLSGNVWDNVYIQSKMLSASGGSLLLNGESYSRVYGSAGSVLIEALESVSNVKLSDSIFNVTGFGTLLEFNSTIAGAEATILRSTISTLLDTTVAKILNGTLSIQESILSNASGIIASDLGSVIQILNSTISGSGTFQILSKGTVDLLSNVFHQTLSLLVDLVLNSIGNVFDNLLSPLCGLLDGIVCGGNGTCTSGSCLCNHGIVGDLCDVISCFGDLSNSSSVCNGVGKCIGVDLCLCDDGYEGLCTPKYESSFTPKYESSIDIDTCDCNSRQECLNEVCECLSGFSGISCSDTDIELNIQTPDIGCQYVKLKAELLTGQSQIDDTKVTYQWNSELNYLDFLDSETQNTVQIPSSILPVNSLIAITVTAEYAEETFIHQFNLTIPLNMNGSEIVAPSTTPRMDLPVSLSQYPNAACPPVRYIWSSRNFTSNWTSTTAETTIPRNLFPANEGLVDLSVTVVFNYTGAEIIIPISSVEIYIQVQNPVIVFSGSVSISDKVGETIKTNMSQSYDPEEIESSQWQFSIQCATTAGNCSSVKESLNTFDFSLLFQDAGQYTYTVLLTVGKRSVSRTLFFDIMPADSNAPLISILTSSTSDIVNRNQKIVFTAQINSNITTGNVVWKWVAYKSNNLSEPLQNFFSTRSLERQQTALNPEALQQNSKYTIQLQARFENSSDVATASLQLKTGGAPHSGQFNILPANGLALKTMFSFVASNWIDDYDTQPLLYIYEYWDPIANEYYVLTSSRNTLTQLVLPSGFDESNLLQLSMRAVNSYGEQAIWYKNVTVAPATDNNIIQRTAEVKSEKLSPVDLMNEVSIIAACIRSGSELKMKLVLSELLNIVHSSLNGTSDNIIDSLVPAMDIASRYSNLLSIPSKVTIMTMMRKLFSIKFSSISNGKLIAQAGRIISRSFDASQSDYSLNSLEATIDLANIILNQKLPSEGETIIQNNGFQMYLYKDIGSAIQNSTVQLASGELVQLPASNLLGTYRDDALSIKMISFNDNPYAYATTTNTSAAIVEFVVSDEAGNKLNIDSVILKLPRKQMDRPGVQICKFWNVNDSIWDTYGCTVGEVTEDNVYCHCNHTTCFSSFIQYDETVITSGQPFQTSEIITLIFHGVFLVVSVMLFGFLIVCHDNQPVRSRFIAPYIGIIAIIIETILQGIVRNALLFVTPRPDKALNILSNVIVVIVSPLNLLALFVFAWQLLRYILLKHVYSIMKVATRPKLLLFKAMTSKLLYAGAATVFAVLCTIYYLAIVLSTSKAVNNSVSVKLATSLPATSYLVMALVLAVAIASIFIWDLLNSISSHRAYRGKIKARSDSGNNITLLTDQKPAAEKQTLSAFFLPFKLYFSTHDPLKFRSDAICMVAAITVMAVSYGIGLPSVFNTYSRGTTASETSFSLLFIIFKILAFAGMLAIFTFKNKLSHNKFIEDLRSTGLDDPAMVLVDLLNDEVGYELVEEFCIQEFSLENLLLYKDISNTQSMFVTMNAQERFKSISELHGKYVHSGSPCEVNINSTTRKTVTEIVEKQEAATVEDCQNMMYALNRSALQNLSDTFSRLASTPEYISYLKAKEMQQKLKNLSTFEIKDEK
jgi:hypothetical protein